MTQKNDIYKLYWVALVIGGLFFNGSAKAQETRTGVNTRNPQGVLHVDGKGDNYKTGVPTEEQAANDVVVTEQGLVGVGILQPTVKLDLRSVKDHNALGLGTTTMSAAEAQAGAVRYEATQKKIQTSDGVVWETTIVPPVKAVVIARMGQSFSVARQSEVVISGWDEIRDMSNSFTPSTGVFAVPRDGVYTFLLTYNFLGGDVVQGSRVEVQFVNQSNTVLARSYKTFGKSHYGTNGARTLSTQVGGAANITLQLAAGTEVRARIWQNITPSGSRGLRVSSDYADPNGGFNNLTIIEH